MNLDKEKLMEYAVEYGVLACGALLLFLVAWIFSRMMSGLVGRALRRADFDETLTRFFAKLTRWIVLTAAVVSILGMFGVETTSFAALIGAAGLAVGLALQGTLGHFASGVMLLIFRPFKVDDVVNIAGHTGKVFEIDLFTTTLDTFDNRRIVVPNGSIFGSTIENITHHAIRRADVEVGTDYSADLDQTRQVLEQAAAAVTGGLTDPEPAVVLLSLGASSIDWSVRLWCNTADYGGVKQALTREIKNRLDSVQIGIPYPQMDVHVDQLNGS